MTEQTPESPEGIFINFYQFVQLLSLCNFYFTLTGGAATFCK